jgi:hypothetical protein
MLDILVLIFVDSFGRRLALPYMPKYRCSFGGDLVNESGVVYWHRVPKQEIAQVLSASISIHPEQLLQHNFQFVARDAISICTSVRRA